MKGGNNFHENIISLEDVCIPLKNCKWQLQFERIAHTLIRLIKRDSHIPESRYCHSATQSLFTYIIWSVCMGDMFLSILTEEALIGIDT